MAATKAQRIGIWIIAAFMAIGTIGSFAIIVLANQNEQNEQARFNELQAQYQKDMEEQDKKLSDKYYDTFSKYGSRVGEFDPNVTELKVEDLAVGDGEEVTEESGFTAYYIGWKPDGEIFQQSIDGDKLSKPYSGTLSQVIAGWKEGLKGMKVGGVRELTIPSEKAYGEAGSENIPANTPLKFIVMLIPTPEQVEAPQELIELYGKMQRQ